MSKDEASPLLSSAGKGKGKGKGKESHRDLHESVESTPLLASASTTPGYDGDGDGAEPETDNTSIRSHRSHTSSTHGAGKKGRRWPSCIAMGVLACVAIAIIILAFIVPNAVQEYAQQATVIEPTSLSIDSITADGVRARIQAKFRLDGSRVQNDHVRRIGRASTWVANQLASGKANIDVYVPDYDNIMLGSAVIPPLVVSLRDGITTQFDFIADIIPGNVEGMRTIANDWLDGKLDMLRLNGKTDLQLKSGFLPLGTHAISETLVFEANKIPAMPKYNITRFNVEDGPMEGSMLVDVSLSAFNKYPIQLDIPELAFEIMVPGCADTDPLILVSEASTSGIHVQPLSDVFANVYGVIHELPDTLTRDCPDSSSSPLDMLLKQYMHGKPATLYIRGSSRPDGDTPRWIADILASITVPVPFPGRSLDGLIKDFSLSDVHFTLPDPFADPNDPAANPKVSGNILVTASLPSDMNFGINVTNWQHANSTRTEAKGSEGPSLKIESHIIEAPLNITDGDVFADVVQALLFGGKAIRLDVQALVDVKVETSLGGLVLKEVPAEGNIPVKRSSSLL
ncbi:putative pre-rRNA processing protein [Rosellinia necatrix]|uniref:Putative pre-rRNA processing protein n=1 Tax=Rosellinia necatrix TaxID=77044 RepID=A0A1S7UKZ9_ROSNE|nr:putative pre-rRNA processing protein [Rosellinia necatrix]